MKTFADSDREKLAAKFAGMYNDLESLFENTPADKPELWSVVLNLRSEMHMLKIRAESNFPLEGY